MRPFLVSALLFAACTDQPTDRAGLMQRVLVDDNAVYRPRDPALLADKYAVMAADRYDFFRGSAAWFYADITRRGGPQHTAGGLDLDGAQLLVVADPHPENLGTVFSGGLPGPGVGDEAAPLAVEWVDLDGATWGPWTLDLRRAALGVAAALEPTGCDCADDGVRALAAAYAATLAGEPVAVGLLEAGMLAEADEEGRERKRLDDRAPLGDDGRRHLLLDPELVDGEGMLALRPAERAWVERVLPRLGDWRLVDAARRYGKGVASRPATRVQLVLDRGDDGPDDDVLAELREVFDPPSLPTAPANTALFANNAERLRAAAVLWAAPDGMSAAAMDGSLAVKLSFAGSWSQDLDHQDLSEDFAAGELSREALVELGSTVGRCLALAHQRAPTAHGQPASWSAEGLSDELVEVARADLRRLEADHQRFVQLLAEAGPWLGADLLEEP